MKKILVAAAAIAAVAFATVPFAQADVARYQFTTANWTVTVNGFYQHSYTVTISPCDGSFTGTGQYPPSPATPVFTEVISGTIAGTAINYTATYNTGYQYYLVSGTYNPVTGGFTGTGNDNDGNSTPGSLTISGVQNSASQSTWRNHGDYVSSQPKGSRETAAQSCIGKPIQSS